MKVLLKKACRSLLPWRTAGAPPSPPPKRQLCLEPLEDRELCSLAAVAPPYVALTAGQGLGDQLVAALQASAPPVNRTATAAVPPPSTRSPPLPSASATPNPILTPGQGMG